MHAPFPSKLSIRNWNSLPFRNLKFAWVHFARLVWLLFSEEDDCTLSAGNRWCWLKRENSAEYRRIVTLGWNPNNEMKIQVPSCLQGWMNDPRLRCWTSEFLHFPSLSWFLSRNSRRSNMLEPNKKKTFILTWRMPFGPNMLVFLTKSCIGLRFALTSFLFFFFSPSPLHNILSGRWAGMRERLQYHHQNHNQERQVCAWLHICGGGHVCFTHTNVSG